MFGLGFLAGGQTQSFATGAATGGSVIVGRSGSALPHNGGPEAFRWTPDGGMQGLGFLGGERQTSSASDVSADGRIIVGSSVHRYGGQAFRWTELEGMVGLGVLDPDIQYSEAYAVSSNGRWIVGASASETISGGREDQAVLWTPEGEIQRLGFLPGDDYAWRYSGAGGVSDDGRVVVGAAYTGTIGSSQQAVV